MPETRVRLLPIEKPVPPIACMPLEHSRRWYSVYEDQESKPVVSVFVMQNAYVRAVVHAASELNYEVGGVLVGKWYADADSVEQFIVIEAALPARFTQQGSVYLTFTQDSIVDIHDKIDERFQGKEIVGWYHTHPRMGVFLSQYDTWLHRYFFPEPWQVALVIEPHSATGGYFIRQADGILDPSHYYGFYELNGNIGRSVVRWCNLQDTQGEAE